ncbi:hypothetical protein C1645_833772 [Glomus cerebriforme]|uniref:Uncharacterized protein n=1 Tax=Glomus cerebriforme TaxID=658196 RepID=A0A397SAY6_9GLOM|nr:hypothetical protein C1645_833772 [Glomus cerebriforme]
MNVPFLSMSVVMESLRSAYSGGGIGYGELHSPAPEDYNNEDIENSATVEAIREEEVSAKVDSGNINIEQTIESTQEIRDKNEKMICVKSILEDSMTASNVEKAVADFFLNNFSTTTIIDLCPKSEFSLALDSALQMEILHEIFDQIDNEYITDEIHDFLITFFNENQSVGGWDEAINNMTINNDCSKMLGNTKKLIKETLPKFLKAFSLAGFLNDVVNYPIICGERARSGASQQKSIDDNDKNAKSMKVLYNNIAIAEADSCHQLFMNLKVYGLTVFKTEVSLTMMDFCRREIECPPPTKEVRKSDKNSNKKRPKKKEFMLHIITGHKVPPKLKENICDIMLYNIPDNWDAEQIMEDSSSIMVRWFSGDWTLSMRKERQFHQAVINNLVDDVTEENLMMSGNFFILNQAQSFKIVKNTKGKKKIRNKKSNKKREESIKQDSVADILAKALAKLMAGQKKSKSRKEKKNKAHRSNRS